MVMASEPKTASKASVNFESRSRIRKVESAELITEVHQEVPGGLGSPGRGRVRGHPEEMDPSGADFHHEQGVEAA